MQKKKILITSYPKSGITWCIRLLCDLLNSPQQDTPDSEIMWHGPGRDGDFVLRKRHEYYQPKKHDGKTIVFLQRDPRDVVISAWFYRGCKVPLAASMQTMWTTEPVYKDWVGSWDNKGIHTSYEDIFFHSTGVLYDIFFELMLGKAPDYPMVSSDFLLAKKFNYNKANSVIKRQSFANMQKAIDTHFVRKGIVGDWKNHFTRAIAKEFNEHLGEFMLEQGYVNSLDWWKEVK